MGKIILILFLLTASVIIGGLMVVLLDRNKNKRFIKLALAFSGGFLLSIAFIHFIPELYIHSSKHIGTYILLGFLIQLILEFFSGGIEHGHMHTNDSSKIPWGLLLALGAHSFLEGIPLGAQESGIHLATTHHDHGEYSLLVGIILHRVPVAIALMSVLVFSKIKRNISWLILVLFAITAPIGTLLGYYGSSFSEIVNFDYILAIIVGMFLHISTTIIFESSENHKFNFIKLVTLIAGCALAFFVH